MIERVARALCTARGDDPDGFSGYVMPANPVQRQRNWERHVEAARAAIEAMREPTEAMKRAPQAAHVFAGDYIMHTGEAEEAWEAMIDAALK